MTAVMLLNLVGLLICFGLEKVVNCTDYWTTVGDSFLLYGRSFAGRSIISRNKFFSLGRFLHVSDIDTEDLDDRLCKVRPMMEHLNDSSQRYLQPDLNISIDECMVKSKGRFPMCQYIKSKPVKWCFKLWCLCNSETGYTYLFTVYRGKQGEVRSSNGLAYDVVVDLVKGLENQGYRLFTNNFYSSPILFEYLKANGFEACGTIDIKRRNVPKCLKSLKTELAKSCTERGEGRWVRGKA